MTTVQADQNQSLLAEIEQAMAKVSPGLGLEIPPPAFRHMDGRMERYVRKKELTCTFFADPKFSNPMHVMQGGFISAAIDNTMGPLSYLAASAATTTLDLNVNYIRMIQEGQRITVTARVVARGTQTIYFEAEVRDAEDKLAARATSQVFILRKR